MEEVVVRVSVRYSPPSERGKGRMRKGLPLLGSGTPHRLPPPHVGTYIDHATS